MSVADKDGFSYREILEGLLERSRNPQRLAEYEKELAGTPMPSELIYLWRAYNRLRRRQGSSGFGASPIGWPELDAFVRHSQFHLAPWEIEVIEDLDDLYLKVQGEAARKNSKS